MFQDSVYVLQINNTYEACDTFSRVVGNHTIKVGPGRA